MVSFEAGGLRILHLFPEPFSGYTSLSFFFTNLLEYYTPRVNDGELVFPIYLPKDFRAPFVDPLTATGPAVLEIFSNPEQYTGASLPVIGEFISPAEIVQQFTEVTGKKAVYTSAYTREDLLHYSLTLPRSKGC